MFKIISLVFMLLLFSACSNKEEVKPKPTTQVNAKKVKTMHKPSKMFQTVSKDKAVLVQKGAKANSCAVCGMNLTKFYKTSHNATKDGEPIQYCSIHCLANNLESGVELENPNVVDVKSLKFIPVLQAYYVVGSDVRGTMSRVSKYAFASLDDAKAFQKKHGGKIMDFRGALEVAKKDFK